MSVQPRDSRLGELIFIKRQIRIDTANRHSAYGEQLVEHREPTLQAVKFASVHLQRVVHANREQTPQPNK